MRWLWLVILFLGGWDATAAESLPSKPTHFVSDRAFVLDDQVAKNLNDRLADFERETSNQVVVAIFGNLPTGAELAQYSTQVFRSWKVGQADKDNGVVLFIYKNDRKLFIATGRGMEGALPDVLCKQIIENEIVPKFRSGDFNGGISAGVEAILAATKGEYKGTGRTVRQNEGNRGEANFNFVHIIFIGIVIFIFIQSIRRSASDRILNRRGIFNYGSSNVFGQGSNWGGGSSSGGSSWGGGGDSGGFSGGGGDSGGGGAGGSW